MAMHILDERVCVCTCDIYMTNTTCDSLSNNCNIYTYIYIYIYYIASQEKIEKSMTFFSPLKVHSSTGCVHC